MIKFFCEACQKPRPVSIGFLETDELNKPRIWSDIICQVCHFVIATVEADEPGQYDFVKVGTPTFRSATL